ncbi:MAG: glycosyltransferase family 2 protein [Rickettsiaceae bacterium]|nr:glycosyltransferase family 2 protein [Rickettsiaceae bacterium]
MDISVIIVSYYTTSVLFDAIGSAKRMKGVKEVIIVNNGNPPEDNQKLDLLSKNGEITLIDHSENLGFSTACNLGAQEAGTKYLLFLNPDCYTEDADFALKLKNALEENEKYWFSTSLILNQDGTIQPTCRRNLMTLSNAIIQSLMLDKLGFAKIDRNVDEIANLPDISDLEAFSGAVFFCSKEHYNKVGGLSSEYFLHVEDMDLCKKINLAGGKICFVKNASIYHKLSTSQTTNKFLEYHKAKGFLIYFRKFFPYANFPIISQILYCGIWLRYYLKTGIK